MFSDDLINIVSSPVVNNLLYSELSQYFYISETSESNLRWAIDRFNCSNTLKAQKDSKAGTFSGATGWSVPFKGRYVKVHRVVWVLHNKTDLTDIDLVINHIDGNPSNNKIENLELCTQRVNVLKKTKHPRNTTGYVGVRLDDKRGRLGYIAKIIDKNGKEIKKHFSIRKLENWEFLNQWLLHVNGAKKQ
jgi:hypothetical protein